MQITLNEFKTSASNIKSNLAKNKLKTAVEQTLELMASLQDEELECSAITISARFYNIKDKEISGVVNLNDNKENNQLIKAVVGLLYIAEGLLFEKSKEKIFEIDSS